jgi:hypothetical protein
MTAGLVCQDRHIAQIKGLAVIFRSAAVDDPDVDGQSLASSYGGNVPPSRRSSMGAGGAGVLVACRVRPFVKEEAASRARGAVVSVTGGQRVVVVNPQVWTGGWLESADQPIDQPMGGLYKKYI